MYRARLRFPLSRGRERDPVQRGVHVLVGTCSKGSRQIEADDRARDQGGKLSASRGDDGSYLIDPAELARVFPVPGPSAGPVKQDEPGNGIGGYDALRLLLAEREETIRDLRQRLNDSESERRRAQERLTALLTHRQSGSVPTAPIDQRVRPFWRRWFR
jgi:hypothetical protein